MEVLPSAGRHKQAAAPPLDGADAGKVCTPPLRQDIPRTVTGGCEPPGAPRFCVSAYKPSARRLAA